MNTDGVNKAFWAFKGVQESLSKIEDSKEYLENPVEEGENGDAIADLQEFIKYPETSDADIKSFHQAYRDNGNSNEIIVRDSRTGFTARPNEIEQAAQDVKDKAPDILGDDNGAAWIKSKQEAYTNNVLRPIVNGIKKAYDDVTAMLAT